VWREFDGFYVLNTAAALKIAKGKEVMLLVVILAEGVTGSQRESGQKEIETAKIPVRIDQRCNSAAASPYIVFSVGASLLAKRPAHSIPMSPDTPPSRASPLPQGVRGPCGSGLAREEAGTFNIDVI
jgi:hypothetical protein